MRVLDVLKVSPGGLTVTELAARLGVNRTVVYRLVSTLEQHALVRKDGHGRLHVGLGVLHLAAAYSPCSATSPSRCCAAWPKAGCTAHLTIADGEEALALAVVEPSWTDYHVSYRIGSRHPLRQGAAGKAILLGREPGPRRTPSPRASCRRGPAGWPPRSAGSRAWRPASASSRSA